MADLSFDALHLNNFKGFSGTHKLALDQEPGLYHVSGSNKLYPELGANGVGKSSLWDALLWVLFGKTGRDAKPGSAIVPWAGDKKGISVKLSFGRAGEQYQLERTRNPNHLLYARSGSEPREITNEEVPKLLGMSEETFRRTMILGQFGTLFLDLKADQQAQMFSEALQLDVWLNAAAIAAMAARETAGKLGGLESEGASIASLVEELSDQMVQAKQRAQDFDAGLDDQVDKLKKNLKAIRRDLADARADLPKKPVRQKPEDRLNEIADDLVTFGRELALENAARDVAVARYQDLDKQLKHLESTRKKKCPTCGQSLTFAQYTDQVRVISNEMHELEVAGSKRKALLVKLSAQCDALEIERASIREDVLAMEAEYDDALRLYDAAAREVAKFEREEQDTEAEIQRVDKSENIHWGEFDRLVERRQDKRRRAGQVRIELEEARRRNSDADFWAKAFREIRLSIIDDALLELEIAAARHAAMLGLNDWGIKFETEREMSSGNLAYKFTVLLYPPGEKSPIKWESYSGGESQRWQLAVAFGLSEVLLARAGVNPNIEVLDEPTRGLSPEGISDLLEHLGDRARELGRAIYLVDHHSLDRGSFDATLLVSKDKKGSSFKWL